MALNCTSGSWWIRADRSMAAVAVLLLALSLASCRTLTTVADVERRTSFRSVSDRDLMVDARNVGLGHLNLRPLVMARAALVARERGFSHVRLLGAKVLYEGGPANSWRAIARVRLIQADEAQASGMDYEVDQVLALGARSSPDAMQLAATLTGTRQDLPGKAGEMIAAPMFVDALQDVSGLTAFRAWETIVKVPSGPAQPGVIVSVRRVPNDEFTNSDVFLPATLDPGRNYEVRASLADNKVTVWLEDREDRTRRSVPVEVVLPPSP